MATVGYARVSSSGQSLSVQLDKLKDCDKIFQEKKSGLDETRSVLKNALDYVREGDIFTVTKLDRLARSTAHLCKIAEILEQKSVALKVLDQNIDTKDATGRLIFNVLGAIGQFETEIRAERQMDGILKAKERGVKFGKKKYLTHEQLSVLKEKREQGVKIKTLMQEFNLSKATIYRYLAQELI
ncbi:resolvase (plasmid) [Rickettsia amblyommatis]|uniref:Site-specific recombinase n=2 Tax=Rickettsia amblyommatis TaxID=33989 RepID=H8K684_RICAG|nr:recombinase family protein [Rickettsia amblyommatis]ADD14622.1 site-specific recombinase [Rickettsia amblyommatis str. AaR/SC]AFC70395.1 site-specific recombinase [Rickettsia amblyommatis str. GAT-30V]ARD88214.1 resolvase [Rickettsia amblyommatis]KJV98528.1 resolvase, N terminal domain protein [Rickettsia amblyommatis str. Darkwater]KJV98597.1 resolvase, N terminal domain protein [Rickettsia amblyommatis str. Darkwater]